MSRPADLRTILPLAFLTCTGMLAMDLYLPAVPAMQRALDLSVPEGQATVAIFLAGLAASQLVWGEALHAWGARTCTKVGLALLIAATIGCALAPGFTALMAMRLLQGIGAGFSTVVVPAVIKSTLGEEGSHRGIAAVSMVEAIVPAAGPVLGTLLLLVMDWRWTFALVALMALVAAPFALRAVPAAAPDHEGGAAGYIGLMRERGFLQLAFAHSLSFSALFVFVASGPQVLNSRWGAHAFALTQVVGVTAFIVAASQSSRVGQRFGRARTVQAGAALHMLACLTFLALAMMDALGLAAVLVFWGVFCAIFGVRGPAAFSDALNAPAGQVGRASAVLVLMLLLCSAAATQLAAYFLERFGLQTVGAAMVLVMAASLLLVLRYPAPRGMA